MKAKTIPKKSRINYLWQNGYLRVAWHVWFLSAFLLLGLLLSPKISPEISEKFPELTKDFKYFEKYVEDFNIYFINISQQTGVASIIIFICLLVIIQIFRDLLLNPTKKNSRQFGIRFINSLFVISIMIENIILAQNENKPCTQHYYFYEIPSSCIFSQSFALDLYSYCNVYCKAKRSNQENTKGVGTGEAGETCASPNFRLY